MTEKSTKIKDKTNKTKMPKKEKLSLNVLLSFGINRLLTFQLLYTKSVSRGRGASPVQKTLQPQALFSRSIRALNILPGVTSSPEGHPFSQEACPKRIGKEAPQLCSQAQKATFLLKKNALKGWKRKA